MPKVFPTTLIILGLAAVIVCQAQERNSSGSKQPVMQSTVAVPEKLAGLNEDLAAYRFRAVHEQLVELSKKFPETSAGKEAQEMLKRAGLHLHWVPNYGIYPKDTIVFTVPITR